MYPARGVFGIDRNGDREDRAEAGPEKRLTEKEMDREETDGAEKRSRLKGPTQKDGLKSPTQKDGRSGAHMKRTGKSSPVKPKTRLANTGARGIEQQDMQDDLDPAGTSELYTQAPEQVRCPHSRPIRTLTDLDVFYRN